METKAINTNETAGIKNAQQGTLGSKFDAAIHHLNVMNEQASNQQVMDALKDISKASSTGEENIKD